mgnify:CR=1 FL=1
MVRPSFPALHGGSGSPLLPAYGRGGARDSPTPLAAAALPDPAVGFQVPPPLLLNEVAGLLQKFLPIPKCVCKFCSKLL